MRVSQQSLYILSATIFQKTAYARLFSRDNLAGATPVEVDYVFPDNLPAPEVKVDLSTEHWEGRSWHYSTHNHETGKREAFSVAIIDHGSMHVLNPRQSTIPRENGTSTDPTIDDGERIGEWVCDYVYDCVNAVTLATSISIDQMSAAKRALADRIHANNNELGKRMIDGVLIAFSISIVSGIAQYYINNAIQKDPLKSLTDTCSAALTLNRKIEQDVAKLQTDMDDLRRVIAAGSRLQARVYDHYSSDRARLKEGQHLRHAVKTSRDRNDHNPMYCD